MLEQNLPISPLGPRTGQRRRLVKHCSDDLLPEEPLELGRLEEVDVVVSRHHHRLGATQVRGHHLEVDVLLPQVAEGERLVNGPAG
jgi:hypothetical protein